MDLKYIEDKINEKFKKCEYRQIVVWVDESGEFLEDVEDISLEDAKLYIFDEDIPLYTKYYIEYVHRNENFLLYIPHECPLNPENFLVDIITSAEVFSADKISLIAQDLNINPYYKNILEKYFKFFNAKDRRKKFKKLNIDFTKNIEGSEEKIFLGILAVLTKQDSLTVNPILRTILIDQIIGKQNILDQLVKYNLLDDFWNLVNKNFGYEDEDPSIENLMIFLIINYSASLFKSNPPKKWNQYLVENKKNSSQFINEFLNLKPYTEDYNKIADKIEDEIKVANSIKNILVENYIRCDSFRIFDRKILEYYISLLKTKKNPIDLDFLKDRKNTHFYDDFEDEYLLLFWANSFIENFKIFEDKYVSSDVNHIIEQYRKIGVPIDMCYRKFYYFYNKIDDKDYIKRLRKLIENMYSSFLKNINPDFNQSINQLDSLNKVDIRKQWNFFKDNKLQKRNINNSVVFISDAFRYSCASELEEKFKKELNCEVSLEPMFSTIPSYTALGMATLLPYKKIEYDNSTVLVDGKRVKSTEEKRAYLEEKILNSALFQYDDLNELDRQERRSKITNNQKKLLYIYHNKIDARGDHAATEHEVFNASQDAIKDIFEMVKSINADVGFSTFYITADHGFIYKKDKLKEYNKIALPKEEDVLYDNRRFLLTDYAIDHDHTYSFSLDYIGIDDIYVTIPRGIEVFKKQGSGLNFVHGGASLQECIIPLLKVKIKRGSKNQTPVELQLSSNSIITNYKTTLSFIQKENVSDEISVLNATLYFVDEDDKIITNKVFIDADVCSEIPKDRQFKREFTFIDNIDYSKDKNYYLIIRDDNNDVYTRTPFMIDFLPNINW